MEESSSSPDEEYSSAPLNKKRKSPLNKKRKSQNEPQELPLSKHVCFDQTPKRDLSSDRESAEDSNSLQCNMDSAMSKYETKTGVGYSNIHDACDEPSNKKISVDSSESGSLATSSSTCTGRIDCFLHLYELQDSTLESDCSCSEYRNDGLENCADSEIENMLCSNGIAPRNYVLSSGRWSVNQDTDDQQESKKPTIDQEFEQYFSMLML